LALKAMPPPTAAVDELFAHTEDLIRLRRERGISLTRMMKEIEADARGTGDWCEAFRIAVREIEAKAMKLAQFSPRPSARPELRALHVRITHPPKFGPPPSPGRLFPK
jgi:hypothetical protein